MDKEIIEDKEEKSRGRRGEGGEYLSIADSHEILKELYDEAFVDSTVLQIFAGEHIASTARSIKIEGEEEKESKKMGGRRNLMRIRSTSSLPTSFLVFKMNMILK